MSTAAIVAAKSAKRQEAEEKRKAETLEDPPAPVQPAKKKKTWYGGDKKSPELDQEKLEKVKDIEIPLRVILHVLRQKKKDSLYVQLCIYFIFMCSYSFIIYNSHKPFEVYTQNFGITDVIVNEPFNERDPDYALTSTHDPRTFTGIGETDEFWSWMESVVVGKFFPDGCETTPEGVAIQGQNFFVQKLQIRQARSKKVIKDIRGTKYVGYDFYSSASKTSDENSTIYGDYKTGLGDLEGFSFGSGNTVDYGNSGYITYLDPRDGSANVTSKIKAMKNAGWLDGGTRMIAVNANFYNPTTDMVTSLRCGIELMPTGFMTNYYFAYTWPRSPHDTSSNVVLARMLLEAVVGCFMLYLLITELKELYTEGCGQYATLFNVVEFIAILAMIGVVMCQIFFEYQWMSGRIDQVEYQDWFYLGELWEWKRNLVGFSFVMGWVKVFKFLEMNSKIKIIWMAIHNTRDDLLSTFLFFVILIFAFGSCGFIIFGNQVEDFSTISSTMSWLMRALLGDLDYQVINEFNPDVAPIYFMSYMVVVFFITLNLMIAIIIDGYEEAKQSIMSDDDHDLLFIHDCLRSITIKCTSRIKKVFMMKKLKKLTSSVHPEPTAEGGKDVGDKSRRKSIITEQVQKHNLDNVHETKLEIAEFDKRTPAARFKKRFDKAVMAHYEQLSSMERMVKESMNQKPIILKYDDLRALNMSGEQSIDVLLLYQELIRTEDGLELDTTSHEHIPLTRQIAVAIDSLQTQMEFVMKNLKPELQIELQKFEKGFPKSSRIHTYAD